MKLYFPLEEPSMQLFLRGLLPRVFPNFREGVDYFLRPHQGKGALQQAIVPFIKQAKRSSGIKVVIVHDQDNDDCTQLKQKLSNLCAGAQVPVMIRIPCRELEAWYLGDHIALQEVFPEFIRIKNKKQFRNNPDILRKPSDILSRNISLFTKSSAAKEIGKIINIKSSESTSFKFFISGLKNFVKNAN